MLIHLIERKFQTRARSVCVVSWALLTLMYIFANAHTFYGFIMYIAEQRTNIKTWLNYKNGRNFKCTTASFDEV